MVGQQQKSQFMCTCTAQHSTAHTWHRAYGWFVCLLVYFVGRSAVQTLAHTHIELWPMKRSHKVAGKQQQRGKKRWMKPTAWRRRIEKIGIMLAYSGNSTVNTFCHLNQLQLPAGRPFFCWSNKNWATSIVVAVVVQLAIEPIQCSVHKDQFWLDFPPSRSLPISFLSSLLAIRMSHFSAFCTCNFDLISYCCLGIDVFVPSTHLNRVTISTPSG